MIRITAGRVVAGVKNQARVWVRSVEEHERKTAGSEHASVERCPAVSGSKESLDPCPALRIVSDVHLSPERNSVLLRKIWKWFSLDGRHIVLLSRTLCSEPLEALTRFGGSFYFTA
jgi:hypothetical protein